MLEKKSIDAYVKSEILLYSNKNLLACANYFLLHFYGKYFFDQNSFAWRFHTKKESTKKTANLKISMRQTTIFSCYLLKQNHPFYSLLTFVMLIFFWYLRIYLIILPSYNVSGLQLFIWFKKRHRRRYKIILILLV